MKLQKLLTLSHVAVGFVLFLAAGCGGWDTISVETPATPPVPQASGLAFTPASSLISRVHAAPQEVIDDLNALAAANQAGCVPYTATPAQLQLIADSLAKLPPLHRRMLEAGLSGIFLVDGFPPGGSACVVALPSGRHEYIACSRQVLEAGLSDWLRSQDESCFIPGTPARSLRIDCGPDTPAFLYILLRESTRVLMTEELAMPASFAKDVWETRAHPLPACDFPARQNVHYFGARGGPQIEAAKIDALYTALARTPFASLYGSQNQDSDLAEFVAFYHLTQKLNLPYRISVSDASGKPVLFEYEPMKAPAVMKRFAAMELFYAAAAAK